MNANAPRCSFSGNEEAGLVTLVYACSGAADAGAIADRASRLRDTENLASMSCLAGIGGRVSGLMASASAAPVLLAIDGCPQDCAKKTLELAGFTGVKHVRVTDLGFVKGKTPVVEDAIRKVAETAAALLKT